MDNTYRGGKFAQKKQTKSQKKEAKRAKQQIAEQAPSRPITGQSLNQNEIYEIDSRPPCLPTTDTLPPWRLPKPGHGVVQASRQAVDSWRSYTNNGTTGTGLNPQASSFTPYQPLRVSNGQAERRAMQGSRRPLHTAAQAYLHTMTDQSSTDQTSPVYTHAFQQEFTPDPDFPIASVEQTEVPIQYLSQRSLRSSSVRAPTPPQPTPDYLLEAAKEPVFTATPRRLLVILDLNGTLLYRPSNVNRTAFRVRPGVPEFLDYLFENHSVMVYTSTRLHNATVLVDKVLTPVHRKQLVALWGREMLGLNSKQFNHKVQVYKKLEDVWNSAQVQAAAGPYELWDQTNTVLVDDSHLKGLAQPYNLLQIDEYTKALDPSTMTGDAANHAQIAQEMVMKQLELQLEALKCQIDVSRLIRKWQLRKRPASTAAGRTAPKAAPAGSSKADEMVGMARQLLTPQSLEDTPERAEEDSIGESEGGARVERSVSPISEDTFKDLLSGLSVKGAPTPPVEDK